jgi:hypothetical protein
MAGWKKLSLPFESKGNLRRNQVNRSEFNTPVFEMAITFATLWPRFDADQSKRLAGGELVLNPPQVQILIPLSFVSFL